MKLTCRAFSEGQPIPKQHTADGPDASPPLQWSEAPAGTKGFALICDDPDAPRGTWVHWVLFNLPGGANSLSEGVAKVGSLPNGARQGTNDFRKLGYGGPSPPPGKPHRYCFKLYALSELLDLKEGATKPELEAALKGRTLEMVQLMGTYGR